VSSVTDRDPLQRLSRAGALPPTATPSC